MSATPIRRTRALVAGLLGATVLAAALPGTAALATATPAPVPTAAPTAARLPALPAPQLLTPVGYGEVLKDVVLDWRPVPGATGYEVQVGVDEGWSDAPTWEAETLSTQVSVPSWLPKADYVWRVAATRPGGSGRWSADGGFRRGWDAAPTPLSPAAGARLTGPYPEFSWTPVEGASGYEVQVSDSPSFSETGLPTTAPQVPGGDVDDQSGPRVDTCFTNHTRVTPAEGNGSAKKVGDTTGTCSWTLLGTGEPRWWRVRALDRFTDDAVPEVDTTPVSDEGVSHLPPSFDGKPDPEVVSACPGSPAGATSPTPTPTSTDAAEPTVPPTATPTPTSGPTGGCQQAFPVDQSRWSAANLFTVDAGSYAPDTTEAFRRTPAPVVQDLVEGNPCSRSAGVVLCTDVPTVRWSPVPGAYAYRLYLSRSATFSSVFHTVDVPALSHTPTFSLADTTAGAAVYVGLQTCTDAGCGPVTSAPPSFRKRTPAVQLAAPAGGSALPAGDVVLRWQTLHDALEAAARVRGFAAPAATQGATGYRVQVTTADDEDFRTPVEDVVVDQPVHATLTTAYGDGAFLWRVQPLDGSLHKVAWSAPARFSRDTVAPTATLAVAKPASADAPFVWRFSEPVTGVGPGTVTVAPAAGALRVAPDGRSASILPAASTWVPGRTYAVGLLDGVTDAVGNRLQATSTRVLVDPVVQDGSRALKWAGTWAVRRATDAGGGTFRTSSPRPTAQSAATAVVHGKGVAITACTGPSGGLADVWIGGTKRLRVDTWRPWSSCGTVIARVLLPTGDHRVQVRGVGRARTRSTGTTLSIDSVRGL